MKRRPPIITRQEAVAKGYRALTNSYGPSEQHMLDSALKSLRGCNVVLVETTTGPEIWRSKAEIKDVRDASE